MKRSDVYLKAAERIFDGRNSLSCCAIANAEHRDLGSPACKEYKKLFLTNDGFVVENFYPDNANGKNRRMLALCFMAAICD